MNGRTETLDGKLISSMHVYSSNNCSSLARYDASMKRVVRSARMLIGEFRVRCGAALDNSCPARDVGAPFRCHAADLRPQQW
jgi:hypothetical protein